MIEEDMNRPVTIEDINKGFKEIGRRNWVYGLTIGLLNGIWIGFLIGIWIFK
ncbi:MAG: hypothetical protein IMZ52_04705 [Actinobacteria bacterium]|nr:hypothetical protein [Actinomycetota bacterium]MBE3114765.1 hypothetical protein [Actinomycetota bacterium]